MKKSLLSGKTYVSSHKFLSLILLGVVAYGGYFTYKKMTDTSSLTRYTLGGVEQGTLISSVSGSGQVSAINQIEIKPKTNGIVASISVKSGQSVKAGDRIASLDATDAYKAVRDAEVNLETARLAYEKLVTPNDALSTLQWQNNIAKAKETKQTAEDNLQKSYDDGFNTIANVFLDLPNIMTGLDSTLYKTETSLGGQEYIDYYSSYSRMFEGQSGKADQYVAEVKTNYSAARASYDINFQDYKNTTRNSSKQDIEKLLTETYETTKEVADTVKSTNNLIQYYEDQSALKNVAVKPFADTQLATLSTYTAKSNSFLTNLLNITNAISTNKNTIINSTRTIAENDLSYQKFLAGADPLDIRNAKINITQKQNALSDTRVTLGYYYLVAPFDGMIAKVNVEKGDTISGGTSVATLVTKAQIASLSLNEVDVSKIKVGQKATMTFDAIEGLTITGEVSEVDTIGTVTQGVATYNVKITFDIQDDRVKPGMTVSAVIVSDVKTDTLYVANNAVKSIGGKYYVEMFDTPPTAVADANGIPSTLPPKQVDVTIGISNDTDTEILTGVKQGDQVVTRTTTPAQATAKTTPVSTRGILGGGGRGG